MRLKKIFRNLLIYSICSIVMGFVSLPQAQASNPYLDAYLQRLSEIARANQKFEVAQQPWKDRIRAIRRTADPTSEQHTAWRIAAAHIAELEARYQLLYMEPLVNLYAWGIPNDAAIQAIQRYTKKIGSGVVEIGAGKGYWAKLLSEQGVEVVAYDKEPEVDSWFPVRTGTETSVIFHSDRALFLCWPPQMKQNGVAFKSLMLYEGRHLIYVGEMLKGPGHSAATGDPDFFELLEAQFVLRESVELPNWPGYDDRLYFFERKEDEDSEPALSGQVRIYVPFRGLNSTDPRGPLRRYHSAESVLF